MENNLIHIVILDYQALIRAGILLIIEQRQGMKVVGDAGNLKDGLEIISQLKPDIVLFDLNMVEESNSNFVSQIIRRSVNNLSSR